MRKRLIPLAILAAATASLASCTHTADPDGTTAAKTLDVWIMEGTNPDSDAFFDEVAAAFTEKTGATLNVEFVQWADAHDRFVTSIAGGTTPDVAETGTTWTAEFADAGALAPLTEYADAGLSADLVEGLVTSGTYDDALYGMPWYAGVRALVYRSDVFEELGLDAPANWDDIVAAGDAIKTAKPDMIPFAVPGNAEMSTYPWVWGAGGEVAAAEGDGWTSQLDSAASREGIAFFTGLATEHGFSSTGATTWKETDVLDNFLKGEVAMAIQGSWMPATIAEKAPDLTGKIAAAPIPGKDGGISPSVIGGSHLLMFQTADDKDLAWEFIQLMTTGEFAEKWSAQSGYFSGQKSLVAETMASTDPLVAPFARQFVEGGAALPVTPAFAAVQAKQTTNAMMQSILSGQKSVEDATSDAAAEMTALLSGD